MMTSQEWEALVLKHATSGTVFDWSLRAHEALIKPVEVAQVQLREAMWECERAHPDERQDARWEVTRCLEVLEKAIQVMADGGEA